MERKGAPVRYQDLLKCFTHLPQTILSLQGQDNMTEYILHALCSEGCLNLEKAAYFIDNPDFNCLKGVAGFDKVNDYHDNDHLGDHDIFKEHLSDCQFNHKVRNVNKQSFKRQSEEYQELVNELAHELDIHRPLFHSWTVKHDNFGLLIFESNHTQANEDFLLGLSLLGFCPVC